jgi:antitoxin (DNA-binding transcriptional repressor) of toxin-antitoxin stability system
MTTVTIEEAQARLPAMIAQLKPGEELVITQYDRPVARLVAESGEAPRRREPGSAIGKLIINVEDDDHLRDFEEYMQ